MESAARYTSAGTSLTSSGWRMSLFVNSFGPEPSADGELLRMRPSSFVNARLSRDLTKNTRLMVDAFNVFDHRVSAIDYLSATNALAPPAARENYLFNPIEPRAVRVGIRFTFK